MTGGEARRNGLPTAALLYAKLLQFRMFQPLAASRRPTAMAALGRTGPAKPEGNHAPATLVLGGGPG